jgi:hypothetical protein
VARDAIQRAVICAWVDAVQTRVAQIRQAWAGTIAEQHEKAEDNV